MRDKKSVSGFGLLCLIASLGGCSKRTPESMCALPETDATLRGMIISGALRQSDRDVSANPYADWRVIKSTIRAMPINSLLSFDMKTFGASDSKSGLITCGVNVSIHLPKQYRDPKFIEMAENFSSSSAPPDLFGERPSVLISYTVQPNASDKKNLVISSYDLGPLSDSIVELAATDWMTSNVVAAGATE
jgi:hypothetical protein